LWGRIFVRASENSAIRNAAQRRYIPAIMSLFWLFSILFLLFAFGVLLWTFVWVARLLAARSQQGEAADSTDQDPATENEDPASTEELASTAAEEEAEELEQTRKGTGVNATLGLILSVFACLLFWFSPLILVISMAGLWFSSQALWLGFRRFRVFIGRAAVGVVLGLASFGLLFGYQTGLFTLPF